MRNRRPIIIISITALVTTVSGQTAPVLALELAPQVSLPVGRDVDVYSVGGGAASLVPVLVANGKPVSSALLSLYWPQARFGVRISPTSWLTAGAHASAGYFFASIDAPLATTSGSNPVFAGGTDLDFRLFKDPEPGTWRRMPRLYGAVQRPVDQARYQLPPAAASAA